MEQLREDKHYTYADYLTWDDEVRRELIGGVIHMMSPAPSPAHQRINSNLHGQLYNFLKGKPCMVFTAPFDVRLNAADGDDTVVQPDLLVICDKSKLDDRGCVGAPDMVVEILSPSSGIRDRVLKFNQYLRAGVREYWIVDPDSKAVSVNVLDSGRYYTEAYDDTGNAPVHVLEGLEISLPDVFA